MLGKLYYLMIFILNISLVLCLLIFLKEAFTQGNSTINFDDDLSVKENPNYLDDSDPHLIWFVQVSWLLKVCFFLQIAYHTVCFHLKFFICKNLR